MPTSMLQVKKSLFCAILGPTASGKSSLAIEVAQKYNGEIISVDSRQIYRGMDIGTGKVTHEEMQGVLHHLLDIANPDDEYNVIDFVRDANLAIIDIQSREKLPILCGGTGFWAQALITEQIFPAVPPDPDLRAQLGPLTAEELFVKLQELNPERARIIDHHNKVRLIRAIEIAHARIKNQESRIKQNTNSYSNSKLNKFDSQFSILNSTLIIALNPAMETLREKIRIRLNERFDQGMIEEVKRLHKQGIHFERLEAFGLEYRWIARYLQNKIDEKTMREKLFFDIVHYAKRQVTWLRRWERQGSEIHWFPSSNEALQYIENSFESKTDLRN